MVQEVRDIMLSMDEMLMAFQCYQRVTPQFLPQAKILDGKINDDTVVLNVEANVAGTPQHAEVIINSGDVLKPLIRFCIENNIMLPFDGKKSVRIQKNIIMLHIDLDLSVDAPALVSPLKLDNMEKAVSGHLPKNGGHANVVSISGRPS
jgi:hypothetical protein